MVKRERETGGGEEREGPCHYMFDLVEIQDPTKGGYDSAYNLQVESANEVPVGAVNIRPIHEGSVVRETYNLSDPKHPKPVRLIHSHGVGEGNMCGLGYRWTTTKEESMSVIEALIFKKKHRIPGN
jgi:hypothetical protein